jgi:hypothetical protein
MPAKRVYFVCEACAKANGGVWPEGHLATWCHDTCDACGRIDGVCGVSDWRWTRGLPKDWVDIGWD